MNIEHTPVDKTIPALENVDLDCIVSSQLRHTSGIVSDPVITDRLNCIMRQNHPLSDAPLTLSEFLSASHLHVATSSADVRFVDNILSGQRFSRKIAVTTPHWLTLPFVLVKTDLISVVSEKMASTPLFSGLQRIELRFEAQPVSWNLYWHKRDENNAAHLWLREQIYRVCRVI
ncbi:LysR substrate-binding domain-containing protein [Pantoea eucalypti]|uniref:LysR substrate-binding domain-containing protein n=1 Tax=Pantoea TaxID=53335 RepID=UPI0009E3944D|nr:LysR substrate-binding domain-containing protein [Pantoea eucalypti]